ncbi:AbiV family abortive infection protein [Micromonospora matsumotoense]|uniref:AbiV family abortive infection protein n=1 Tax=Micromonospora matsumotoense TaxID=121616 RepID=UPI0033C859F5
MSVSGSLETVTASFARKWWRALMANACALVEDADALAGRGSVGRAQAMLVLAMEELAKARWLYEAAEYEWRRPLGLYGLTPEPAGDVVVPEELRSRRLPHLTKLQTAEQYASGLGGFWDASRRTEFYQLRDLAAFEAVARQRNLDKQAGFYVDRDGDVILSPLEASGEGVQDLILLAAQTIEMLLIEDHTRQQDAPDGAPVDSSQDLHWAIMPLSHPQEFAEFVERSSMIDMASELDDPQLSEPDSVTYAEPPPPAASGEGSRDLRAGRLAEGSREANADAV